jgi:glutaredoxin
MRARSIPGCVAALALMAPLGCKRGEATVDAGEASLPEVRVLADGGPYLFSYYGEDGKLHDVQSMDQVPQAARRQVLVRDLGRTPSELQSDRYLYLVDLRSSAGTDGLTTSVVSRYRFDAQDDPAMPALGGAGDEADGSSDGGINRRVIVYGTSWCGACKAAREFLHGHHIPYVEKDIEKDAAAEAELARKAKRAGLKLGGVPVIDVAGQLTMGYDPGTLTRLWAQANR